MSLDVAKDITTIIGVIIGAASLVFTALNISVTRRTNRAHFWLSLRDHFAKWHSDVHRRLRPGGGWSGGGGPTTHAEWAEVEAYMGLFEHCEIMLEQGLIDESTFKEIYAYRLKNLVANDTIRQAALVEHADGWTRFLALLKRMEIEANG